MGWGWPSVGTTIDGWVAAGRVVRLWTCKGSRLIGGSYGRTDAACACACQRSDIPALWYRARMTCSPVNRTHFSPTFSRSIRVESHRANRDLYCAGGRVNESNSSPPPLRKPEKKKLLCEYRIVGYETTETVSQVHGDDIQAVTALLPCGDWLSSSCAE